MKVINLIQNMQAAIDALSFQSADTNVTVTAGLQALTGGMAVNDKDGKITMTMGAQELYPENFKDLLRDYHPGTIDYNIRKYINKP